MRIPTRMPVAGRWGMALLLAVFIQAQAGPAGQGGQTRTYRTRLAPVPIDTAMMASIAGSGSITATLTGTRLSFNGTFAGLRSPATVARVHRAQKGVRGPAVFDLTVTNTPGEGGTPSSSGTITGAVDLTPSQIDDLGRERLYVQLHSEKAPEGNLWGWLQLQETKR